MAEKAKKETAKKAVKAKPENNKAVKEYETLVDEMGAKIQKNPVLKLGMIMSTMQYTDNQRLVLKYISELEKKFTPDELVAIAAKVVKK